MSTIEPREIPQVKIFAGLLTEDTANHLAIIERLEKEVNLVLKEHRDLNPTVRWLQSSGGNQGNVKTQLTAIVTYNKWG